MKFYIATTITNWLNHNKVRDVLVAAGHQITYDWTVNPDQGDLRGKSDERLQEVAQEEMQGIRDADFVAVLLPGGVGTHAEIGAAYILSKPTIINGHPKFFSSDWDTGETRNFYWSPQTTHSTMPSATEFAMEIIGWLAQEKGPYDFHRQTYLGAPIPFNLAPLIHIESCETCPVGGRYNFETGGEQEPTCPRIPLCDWECHRQGESSDSDRP